MRPNVLKNFIGQWLWRMAKPYARRAKPVSRLTKLVHYFALRLSDPNPAKGKPPTLIRPGHHYDADLAQYLIDTNKIITTPLEINPSSYALLQWDVIYDAGHLSQGQGSRMDLIWVLTMSTDRARKPVLFVEDPLLGLPKILDGSHRLVRSIVDGQANIEVQVIGPADVHHIVRPD